MYDTFFVHFLKIIKLIQMESSTVSVWYKFECWSCGVHVGISPPLRFQCSYFNFRWPNVLKMSLNCIWTTINHGIIHNSNLNLFIYGYEAIHLNYFFKKPQTTLCEICLNLHTTFLTTMQRSSANIIITIHLLQL